MGLVFDRKRGLYHSIDTFSALEALKAREQYGMEQHVVKDVAPAFSPHGGYLVTL